MRVHVYLVGPWLSERRLDLELQTAIARIGAEVCRVDEGATAVVRVRRAGTEWWVEADPELVRALLLHPSLCAFELAVDTRAARAALQRLRLDPANADTFGRGTGEGLALPAGADPEDLAELACDLALSRLAADGATVAPGSSGARPLFYRTSTG